MSGRIKVAHIMNSLGLGGMPVVVFNLLKNLPPDRYECYLYCLRKKSDTLDVREKQKEHFEKIGVKVSFPEEGEKKLAVMDDLLRWLLLHRIEILHTHGYRANTWGRLAGILCKNILMISHYHNCSNEHWEKDGSYVIERQLEIFSDGSVACSRSVRNYVAKAIGFRTDKIDVIYNGVDLDKFRAQFIPKKVRKELKLPDNTKVVGLIGRICEQKAQDDFIRAAAIIQKSFPKTVFLVVGQEDHDGGLFGQLKELSRDLKVEENVMFIGYHPNIPLVLSALDILVLPSRWEGFGLVLVEAMASGKPIVATNIGPITEVVSDDTALLVPPNSPELIAKKVIDLLSHPERAKQMGLRGKERAKLFSGEQAGKRIDSLYQKILEKGV